MSSGRTPYTTGACMGLPPKWRVSDLGPSYTNPAVIMTGIVANTLSAAFAAESHSVELLLLFSDGVTKADISLLVDDGTGTFVLVGTRTGCSVLHQDLFFGQLDDNYDLKARSIKVQVSNYTGTGSISVRLNRLN
jgi:hypothetical protein